jgi:outer membrane immunogenic protein
MNWRQASVLCVPVVLMATPSRSADFSSPAHRWSGCHVTIQGSYNTLSTSTTYGAGLDLDGTRVTKDLDPDGFGVGGGVGCDWQSGNWVFGILGDGAFANLDQQAVESHYPDHRFGIQNDWFATARGRIGYAMDRGLIFDVPTMWYLTAGGAWAGLGARNYVPGGETTGWEEKTASGWTVGWGSENALDDRWSIKTETLYIDYGKNTFFGPGNPVSGAAFQTDTTAWVTRLGITYKLTSW